MKENKEQETLKERWEKFTENNLIYGCGWEDVKPLITLTLSQEREKQKEFPLHLDMPLILLGDLSINQHTEKAVSQERSRLLEKVNDFMKDTSLTKNGLCGCCTNPAEYCHCISYNKAVLDIIKAFKS